MRKNVKKFGSLGKGYRFQENHILKNMKAIHILSAIAWGGGAFAMQALHLMRTMAEDANTSAIIGQCSYFIDTWLVMPGLLGCIATGLFYSIFTAFGFFKFLWIAYKWLVAASACFWGLLFWSSAGNRLVAWLEPYHLDYLLIFIRGLILPDTIWAIFLQTLIILSMCLVSIYRPLGWWHKYCVLEFR